VIARYGERTNREQLGNPLNITEGNETKEPFTSRAEDETAVDLDRDLGRILARGTGKNGGDRIVGEDHRRLDAMEVNIRRETTDGNSHFVVNRSRRDLGADGPERTRDNGNNNANHNRCRNNNGRSNNSRLGDRRVHRGEEKSSRRAPHGAPRRRRLHRRQRRDGVQTDERAGAVPTTTIAVLNLQGARTHKKKWALAEREILRDHKTEILMVSETKLMNREKPPKIHGFKWHGKNRNGPSGRQASGGVGILYADFLELELKGEGDDWIAAELSVGMEAWMIISIYWTQSSIITNKAQIKSLSEFIERECGGKGIIIGGDFNAHTHLFAECNNTRGRLLLEFTELHGLVLMNSTDLCKGRKTRKDATIDYILCNDRVLQTCQSMLVDQDREVTQISDHNLISITCRTPRRGTRQKAARVRITNGYKAANIANENIRRIQRAQSKVDYESMKEAIHRGIERASRETKQKGKSIFTSPTIRKIVAEKKTANKVWRKARKNGKPTEVQQAEKEFRAKQVELAVAFGLEERNRYERLSSQILQGPRNERAKRFWNYVSRHNKQNTERVKVRDRQGTDVANYALKEHLTRVGCEALMATPAGPERFPLVSGGPSGIRTNSKEIEDLLSQISKGTATGEDQIPANILKLMKADGVEWLADLFNDILDGTHPLPIDWRDGRVSVLAKPNSTKGVLETYRPITVSTVLYRMFTKILAARISGWIEKEEILGEMQNGFRKGRRGEDNLFILTSAIEIARGQHKGLITCFLDCSKAYDRISRALLWETLGKLGMDDRWIQLLKTLYTDNTVVVKFGDISSSRIETQIGLRQGCPLSPILFALFIADLERRLMGTGFGFEVTVGTTDGTETHRIPAILYADDLCLIGHSYEEMSALLQVTTDIGNEKDLLFNPEKSAVVIFNAEGLGEPREMRIQNKHIDFQEQYKYLGITLCDAANYLQQQELIWKRDAHMILQRMHAQCLWTFNRFEITRIQWKATGVPKLTYANAVLASRASKELTAMFERTQLAAGRWAMGITGHKVASEFIMGEMGWSTFEAREAQSKIRYFARIAAMDSHRWPRMVLSMMASENIFTEAIKRLKFLKSKFDREDIPMEYRVNFGARENLFNSNVKKRIREKQEKTWKEAMNSKTSLRFYREQKIRGVTPHGLYDNSRGSALLALARAGMLPTRHHRSKYQQIDSHCTKCGREIETIPHIIMKCLPHQNQAEELARRLGFTGETDESSWRDTKRMLEEWEKETRRIC
jgi:hypothetical protein